MVSTRARVGPCPGGRNPGMPDALRDLVEKVLAGDRRAMARAISTVEDKDPLALPLLKELFTRAGRALVVGITGSPGAGKSTLVEKLAKEHRRAGARVGILAVDPTSPFSGGAILGDRVRMQSLANDAGVYIRSMATRGQLGGLAPTTHDAVTVLDAAGCEVVLIETVGVGQDEVEVARLADATVLLLVPGMGDDIQTFKAGVMEIADLYVINKADRPGAERIEQEVTAMLSLTSRPDGWRPPVLRTVATTGQGIAELYQALVAKSIGVRVSWKFCGKRFLRGRRLNHSATGHSTGSWTICWPIGGIRIPSSRGSLPGLWPTRGAARKERMAFLRSARSAGGLTELREEA